MKKDFHITLFNIISPVYALFFNHQVRSFENIISSFKPRLFQERTGLEILDLGCGTGALLSVLHAHHQRVTGIEPSSGMLHQARKNLKTKPIPLTAEDLLQTSQIRANSYDFVFLSYVLHGLKSQLRLELLTKAIKMAREKVVVIDFTARGGVLTDISEWLERGDYFHFVKNFPRELKKLSLEYTLISLEKHTGIFNIDATG